MGLGLMNPWPKRPSVETGKPDRTGTRIPGSGTMAETETETQTETVTESETVTGFT